MKTILALGAIVAGLATVVYANPLIELDTAMAADPAPARPAAAEAPAAPPRPPLVAHEVGWISAAFVVHPDNPVTFLSLEQLRDILSGAVRQWSEIGGPDAPIVVAAEASGSTPRRLVEDALLDADGLAPASMEVMRDAERVAAFVSRRPEAIGILPPSLAREGVRRLATDVPIEEPLVMVTRGAPSPAYAKVMDAVSRAAAQ